MAVVDAPVATGQITESFSLTFLPMRYDEIDYNQIKKIKLPVGSEVVGFSVVGYRWFNAMSMDLYLATGITLHLDSGYMAVTPTNDTTFAPTASSWLNTTLAERRRLEIEEDAYDLFSQMMITQRPVRQLVRRTPDNLPDCSDGFGHYEVCSANGTIDVDTGVNVKPGTTGGLDVVTHWHDGPYYPGYDWDTGYIRICGNYCGPGWCAGEYKPEHECFEDGDLEQGEPSGPADKCCKDHDSCCGNPETRFTGNCNEVLANCVRGVLDDRDGDGDGFWSADPGCSKAMQWLIIEYMHRDRACGNEHIPGRVANEGPRAARARRERGGKPADCGRGLAQGRGARGADQLLLPARSARRRVFSCPIDPPCTPTVGVCKPGA